MGWGEGGVLGPVLPAAAGEQGGGLRMPCIGTPSQQDAEPGDCPTVEQQPKPPLLLYQRDQGSHSADRACQNKSPASQRATHLLDPCTLHGGAKDARGR